MMMTDIEKTKALLDGFGVEYKEKEDHDYSDTSCESGNEPPTRELCLTGDAKGVVGHRWACTAIQFNLDGSFRKFVLHD